MGCPCPGKTRGKCARGQNQDQHAGQLTTVRFPGKGAAGETLESALETAGAQLWGPAATHGSGHVLAVEPGLIAVPVGAGSARELRRSVFGRGVRQATGADLTI